MNQDRYIYLEPGQLAAVVTFLERTEPPQGPLRPPPLEDLVVEQVAAPTAEWYRGLFRRVGMPWLWSSRLRLPEEKLLAIIQHPRVEVYRLQFQGSEEGLLELDFREPDEVELGFLGVTPRMIGTGAGRYLLDYGIHRAFSSEPRRFWLHTCTMDHPKALRIYQEHGFRPYRRAIEILRDPRQDGIYPREHAPHIPLL